jgi:hypothetical protein
MAERRGHQICLPALDSAGEFIVAMLIIAAIGGLLFAVRYRVCAIQPI